MLVFQVSRQKFQHRHVGDSGFKTKDSTQTCWCFRFQDKSFITNMLVFQVSRQKFQQRYVSVLGFKTKVSTQTRWCFRFQDKSFNTDNALIHVFEIARTVSVPEVDARRRFIRQGNVDFVVPSYIRRKLDR